MFTLLVQKRLATIIQLVCFALIVLIVVTFVRCRKRKVRAEKVESYEHKAQRKQLLSAIPIEDD